ncbi:sulfatase [Termitidicoccus mucosus]|uniref:Sulfatase N-terminal domain-containing protein n=1 Tax=Termitidicoccus mucosus TaxID=1184151 RepID=A0A178IP58_9BACT|nr:hypothetical protein AW736_05160 [Opitutaceae bacterium TSB47]
MRPALISFAVIAAASSAMAARAAPDSPNLVLVIADDCTKYDTEIYGGPAKTPHLMRLAGEGMNLTRCFQASPMCSPTRHALFTAKYPVKTGAYPNHTYVSDGVTSIASWLRSAGYRAALSGKTHINPPAAFPFEYLSTRPIPENKRPRQNPDFTAIDTFLGDCVKNKTPFGLFVCSHEPHEPWNKGDASKYLPAKLKLPPNFFDTPKTRAAYSRYLAEITYFDGQVGDMLALLDKHSLADSTIVIVLTEQGSSFPFAKWTCYDAGVGSGCVIRWPGHIKPGSKSDALVEYIDMIPTVCDAAGIKAPDDLDGRSFLPMLEGKTNKHKEHVFALQTSRGIHGGPDYYGIRTVRDERYRYVRNLTPGVTFKNTAIKTPWYGEWLAAARNGSAQAVGMTKLYQHRPAEELYDCENDPWNMRNLIDDPAFKNRAGILCDKLAAWMKSQGDKGQATEMEALKHIWKNAGDSVGEE